MTWPRALCLVLVVVATCPVRAEDTAVLRGFGDSNFRLATVERGAEHLTRRDAFWNSLSAFDRQSRLQATEDPGTDALAKHFAQQVLAWDDSDVAKLREAINSLRERLSPFPLPLPAEILLIHTTGREEGDAAYCRGAAIVLPRAVLKRPPGGLERLLAHELFHVLSNQNPDLRRRLYQIIGFELCEPIPFPDALAARKITNPDAPISDCLITLKRDEGPLAATPILFASVERYDPTQGGTLFKYLTFRLMAVEKTDDQRWRPALRDGQPQLFDPQQTPAYFEQIGRNTEYIIHADEILADNFAMLVFNQPQPASPQIIQRMREVLGPPMDGNPKSGD